MTFSWIEDDVLAASPLPTSAADLEVLRARGIRAVITLTERPLTVQRDITPELLAALGIITLHVPIDDFHAPSKAQVREVVDYIDRMQAESRPVLIHCKVGQGRTGTLLHAYYLARGMSLAQARQRVVDRRPLCDFVNLSAEQQALLTDLAGERTFYV